MKYVKSPFRSVTDINATKTQKTQGPTPERRRKPRTTTPNGLATRRTHANNQPRIGELKAIKKPHPLTTTIIIPTYNASTLLGECIRNLEATRHDLTQILVVDDASTDQTFTTIQEEFPQLQLTRTTKNLGFAGACNHGLAQVTTPYVAFLNNDAFPEKGWAETLTLALEQDPELAIVCSKILRKDTRIIDSAGGIIEFPLGEAPPRGYLEPNTGQYDQPADVAYASGTAMAVKTELLRQIGGFDANYRNYFEETDLAWRLRLAGYKIRYIPNAITHHLGSATMGRNPAAKTFWQTRNRCITNLKNLETRNLPDWLLYEAVFALLIPIGGLLLPSYRNHALAYLRGLSSFIRTLPSTLLKRSQVQSGRRVADSQLLKLHGRENIATLLGRYVRLVRTNSEHLFAPESRPLHPFDPSRHPHKPIQTSVKQSSHLYHSEHDCLKSPYKPRSHTQQP